MSLSPSVARFDFAPPDGGACDILIVAGEHSGDEQAARMLKGALAANPGLRVCAFGGESLASAGAQLLFDMTAFSVVGLFEVLKNYSFFKKLSESIVDWIDRYRPAVVCLVDYPGFNLRLASALKRRAISAKGGGSVRVVYYIGPQIWAWKAGRRFEMASTIDDIALIFPFEPACYADTSLTAHFVGHPFLDASYENPLYFDSNAEILLLAGSRLAAVSRIFPKMLQTLRLLPEVRAAAPYPTEEILAVMKAEAARFPDVAGRVRFVGNRTGRIGARAVMMSSGTMSLACCLAGIPGLIVYVANPFTYFVGRMLVKVKYLGIANILLDRPAWPEFIQFAASAQKMAERMRACLSGPECAERAARDAGELKRILHSPPKMSAGEWLAGQCSRG